MQKSEYTSRISVFICSAVLTGCAFVCFLLSDAQAGWYLYHEVPGAEKHYYDPESIVIKRGHNKNVRVYRKSGTVDQSIKVSNKIVFGNAVSELKELKTVIEFHCPYRKYRLLKTDKLYKNGIRSIVMKMDGWEDLKTGSNMEELYKKLCALKGTN
jgi:hypothetical protein